MNLYTPTTDLRQKHFSKSLYFQHRKFKIVECVRRNSSFIPIFHVLLHLAIPEPTTIGQQPVTAGSNLTSAINGTYQLYHLPEISNYSDTFGDTKDCPTTKSSMFFSARRPLQNNLHPASSNHYSTPKQIRKQVFILRHAFWRTTFCQKLFHPLLAATNLQTQTTSLTRIVLIYSISRTNP